MIPLLGYGEANPRTRLRNAPAHLRVMYRTSVAPSGCWEFQGCRDVKGYGKARDDDGRSVAPHLITYRYQFGTVPEGLEVDHLCFNRACVRPDHLEAVTREENVRRGRVNQNADKTQCDYGHPLGVDRRVCTPCNTRRTREYRARLAVGA